jgi:release factor glutamine methyltransferase
VSVSDLTRRLQPPYEADEAREIAYRVIEYLSGQSRSDILCHQVDVPDDERLNDIITRLHAHEPIQYILGSVDWMGLTLRVTPDTLIPRPETAELVDLIYREVSETLPRGCRLLDIGTGSGCIAIALKQRCPGLSVSAMDISAAAIKIAEENAVNNRVQIEFTEQDILSDFSFKQYDIVVSNPPYVRPSDEMGENVKRYEPATALFVPEDDPLIFYRRIAELHIGRQLFFEVNELLAKDVASVMEKNGYTYINIYKDIYGKERFVTGRLSE